MLQNEKKPIYNFQLDDSSRITLSTGNSKIGRMINWSTLPGDADHLLVAKGKLITSVPGTCTSKCEGCFKNCYARRSILQHHNSVTKSWTINTLMVRYRPDECFKQIHEEICKLNKKFYETGDKKDLKYEFFRINVSGEVDSFEELDRWNTLATRHPELKFGIYSKNSEVLLEFFRRGQSAANFCINVSEWHGTMKETIDKLHAMGAIFNVFEYDDSNLVSCDLPEEEKARLKSLSHCQAVGPTKENRHPINPKTGDTWHCEECKGCYTKTGIHRCVYSH